jgi:hypothetical protein
MTLEVPKGVPVDAAQGFWTPSEVRYVQSWVAWQENGRKAIKHEFMLKYMGETEMFGVLAEEDESDALIEDMAAGMAERAMVKIRLKKERRGDKLLPEQLSEKEHWQVRRELAAIWRDMRKHAHKRALSSTGRIYYAGTQ